MAHGCYSMLMADPAITRLLLQPANQITAVDGGDNETSLAQLQAHYILLRAKGILLAYVVLRKGNLSSMLLSGDTAVLKAASSPFFFEARDFSGLIDGRAFEIIVLICWLTSY